MPRVIPKPRGNYNARLGKGLTRRDPTRTGRLRKMFGLELRRRFSRLFAETRRLVQDPVYNVFCATGEGGGVDPTCSPSEGIGKAFNTMPMTKASSKEAKAWRKENQKRYETDKDFKAVADAVTLYTQGEYAVVRAFAEKSVTGELPKMYEGSSVPGWTDKPIHANPLSVVKNYFKGQALSMDDDYSHNATFAESGRLLQKAVENAPVSEVSLYRGLVGYSREFSVSLQPGDDFHIMGPSSFSVDKQIGENFAKGRDKGQGRGKSFSEFGTLLEIEPGARALSVSALSPWDQKEVLTTGQFKVVNITEGRDGVTRVKLKQVHSSPLVINVEGQEIRWLFQQASPFPLDMTLNLASTQFNLEQQNLIDDVKHIQSLLDPDDVVELETQPHITVRYGLHGQEADQVQQLYRNQIPLRVKLGGLSLFSNDKQDVLKIDVESRGLSALHSRLGLLPNTSTHPVYHPHLTVAYLKPGTGIKYVGESGLEGTELTFDRLVFSNDEREHTILENAFCPTGPGGGQDNSCSSQGVTSLTKDPDTLSRLDFFEAMSSIDAGAGRGALVSPRELRQQFPNLSKSDFDNKVMKLALYGHLSLHTHDYPSSLSGEERSQLIHNPKEGVYYVGVAIRQKPTRNARTKHQHVNRFMKDFNAKVKTTLNDKPWWEEYINSGLQTGVGRAYDDLKKPLAQPAERAREYLSGKRQFLKSTVKGSYATTKKLYKDVQQDLDRITFQLGAKLSDYLEQALSEGRTLREAAAEILPKLEAEGLRRAENVARYRTIEAHAEGQLAAFEELGVEDLGVLVEWTTANAPCPACSEMSGVVLRPADAHGLIPRHPHCKCAWEIIDSEDVDEDEHIVDRSGIRRAIKASLKQGGRKGAKLDELIEEDEWGGSDVEFEGRLLFNITPELLEFSRFAVNAFCPTGKGGGVDPTCSPSSTTKGGEDLYSATRGKDKVWRMANGEPAPEHIQKLGIPPGWKNVEINPNPKGTTYAKGIDAKGRVQTKYSATKTAQQAAAKFGRTRELIQKRTQIYKELEHDAKDPELKEQAECLKLVMQTGMRPGSDKDTKADHKSYGATTLEGRHVVANKDGTVTLRLVTGKNKGREVDFPVTDKSTASMLKTRAKEAGKTGRLFNTSAANLRDYSKTKDGGGFKTKDHRTALGTETALRAIKRMSTPSTMADYKDKAKAVATIVSKALGNTPPIALKSYIDPQVFASWNKELKK